MPHNISVDFPLELSTILKLNKADLAREIRILTLVKLYELGKVSSSKAAGLLGLSRVEFLELLGRYKISSISVQDREDLLEDVRNA